MKGVILREVFDENLQEKIRLKQMENSEVVYTSVKVGKSNDDVLSLSQPIQVHIRATYKCNLKCPYCYTADHIDKMDMTDAQMKEIIELCDRKGVLGITWTGGEPFVRHNMVDLIHQTYETHMNQTVLTNGTLLKSSITEYLPKDNISYQISLNEIWADDTESRKRNIQILKNAGDMVSVGFKVFITVIIEPMDISKYEELIISLINYGIPFVRFGFEIPVGGLLQKNMETYITMVKQLFKPLMGLKEKYKNQITILYQFDKKCFINTGLPRRFLMCEAGTMQIYIDNNGDVYPCPLFKSFEEFKCGNVFIDSWAKLWNSNPMNKFRNVHECDNCNVICTDWCRALLYPITGKLEGKSLFCVREK